jgi:hypothetical protein
VEIFRKKNEATVIAFPMVTTASPDTFDTGETVSDDGYYSDAGGAWTTLGGITDTVSEIGSTGLYELSLTAGEMDHDNIIIKFTSTNAADTAVIIRTRAVDEDDLVRATTPANTLDVSATGEAGVDWANVGGQSTSVDLGGRRIIKKDTVTTNTDLVSAAAVRTEMDSNSTQLAAIVLDTGTTLDDHLTDIKGTSFIKDTHSLIDLKTETALIVADTNELQTDDVPGLIAALNDISAAEVNAEVVDVVATDTFSEPGQAAALGEDALTILGVLGQLHKDCVRKVDNDGDLIQVYDEAGTTVDQKATVSVAAGTTTRAGLVSGP